MPGEYDTATLQAHFGAISRRFEAIEAQLAIVSEKLGLPYSTTSSSVPTEVVELVRSGETLAAVKRYRELTNASLEEARDVVAGL